MVQLFCEKCSNKEPIPPSSDKCPACQQEISPPNVRAASTKQEIEALDKRLSDAQALAKAGDYIERLEEFGQHVESSSSAVVCRPLTVVQKLISSPSTLYASYYKEVEAETRMPENNKYDERRGMIDEAVFPNYKDEIVFAALTLNGMGILSYGGVSIVLKEDMIQHRTTVFEENTRVFAIKHGVSVTEENPIKAGYRATWQNRGKLAKAKLCSKIDEDTTAKDFPEILLTSNGGTEEDDFIEVHVYKGFNRSAIDKINFGTIKTKADQIIMQSIQEKLKILDIECEESANKKNEAA